MSLLQVLNEYKILFYAVILAISIIIFYKSRIELALIFFILCILLTDPSWEYHSKIKTTDSSVLYVDNSLSMKYWGKIFKRDLNKFINKHNDDFTVIPKKVDFSENGSKILDDINRLSVKYKNIFIISDFFDNLSVRSVYSGSSNIFVFKPKIISKPNISFENYELKRSRGEPIDVDVLLEGKNSFESYLRVINTNGNLLFKKKVLLKKGYNHLKIMPDNLNGFDGEIKLSISELPDEEIKEDNILNIPSAEPIKKYSIVLCADKISKNLISIYNIIDMRGDISQSIFIKNNKLSNMKNDLINKKIPKNTDLIIVFLSSEWPDNIMLNKILSSSKKASILLVCDDKKLFSQKYDNMPFIFRSLSPVNNAVKNPEFNKAFFDINIFDSKDKFKKFFPRDESAYEISCLKDPVKILYSDQNNIILLWKIDKRMLSVITTEDFYRFLGFEFNYTNSPIFKDFFNDFISFLLNKKNEKLMFKHIERLNKGKKSIIYVKRESQNLKVSILAGYDNKKLFTISSKEDGKYVMAEYTPEKTGILYLKALIPDTKYSVEVTSLVLKNDENFHLGFNEGFKNKYFPGIQVKYFDFSTDPEKYLGTEYIRKLFRLSESSILYLILMILFSSYLFREWKEIS